MNRKLCFDLQHLLQNYLDVLFQVARNNKTATRLAFYTIGKKQMMMSMNIVGKLAFHAKRELGYCLRQFNRLAVPCDEMMKRGSFPSFCCRSRDVPASGKIQKVTLAATMSCMVDFSPMNGVDPR